jgi:hypothetical protein
MDRNDNNFDIYNRIKQWSQKYAQSQGIRDQFPGDQWIHFCNSYIEEYKFLIPRSGVF